ncbi:MAG: TOBE domain-containing protein, partial [Rubrimonas sp.]
ARVALGVYQGAFQELHLDCEASPGGRVLVRAPAVAIVEPGARVGIALDPEAVRLFPDAGD